MRRQRRRTDQLLEILRYAGGPLDYQDLAQRLHCTEEAARQLVSRALRRSAPIRVSRYGRRVILSYQPRS